VVRHSIKEQASPDDPERDTVERAADYAQAYASHGIFRRGDAASSLLLAGTVDVSAVPDASWGSSRVMPL
jgi:hypothetical protein